MDILNQLNGLNKECDDILIEVDLTDFDEIPIAKRIELLLMYLHRRTHIEITYANDFSNLSRNSNLDEVVDSSLSSGYNYSLWFKGGTTRIHLNPTWGYNGPAAYEISVNDEYLNKILNALLYTASIERAKEIEKEKQEMLRLEALNDIKKRIVNNKLEGSDESTIYC